MEVQQTNEEFYQAPQPATEMQKRALAKMYANDEYRSYLIHAIQVANKNVISCVKANSTELAKEFSVRADAFEALLNLGKLHYIHFDKIDRKLSTGKQA